MFLKQGGIRPLEVKIFLKLFSPQKFDISNILMDSYLIPFRFSAFPIFVHFWAILIDLVSKNEILKNPASYQIYPSG